MTERQFSIILIVGLICVFLTVWNCILVLYTLDRVRWGEELNKKTAGKIVEFENRFQIYKTDGGTYYVR